MQKGHLYKFTVEHLNTSKADDLETNPLVFEATSHENFFKIVNMMKNRVEFDEEDTKAFAIGLKLFSGVMLKNNKHELFKEFLPHFKEFMNKVKKEK